MRYEGDVGCASSPPTFLKRFRVLIPNQDKKNNFIKISGDTSHFSPDPKSGDFRLQNAGKSQKQIVKGEIKSPFLGSVD